MKDLTWNRVAGTVSRRFYNLLRTGTFYGDSNTENVIYLPEINVTCNMFERLLKKLFVDLSGRTGF